jgi:hypothetical protein
VKNCNNIFAIASKWAGLVLVASCAQATAQAPDSSRSTLLVIGNSLALHTPYQAIGWSGNWGMAASDADHDYAHVLQKLLQSKQNTSVDLIVKNKAKYERSFWQPDESDITADIKPEISQADIIVIQLSDNVSESDYTTYDFPKQYANLIKTVSSASKSSAKLVCVGPWWGNAKKEAAIKDACQQVKNSKYVKISDIGQAPLSKASAERSIENKGVASHPGDQGMKKIAERIYSNLSGK